MSFSKNPTMYIKPSIGQKIGDEFYFMEELPFSDADSETTLSKHKEVFKRDAYTCAYCKSVSNHLFKTMNNSNTVSYIFVDDNLTPFFSRMIKPRSEGGIRDKDNLETCCEKCMSVKNIEISKKLDKKKISLSVDDKKKLIKRYKLRVSQVFGMGKFNKYGKKENLKFFAKKGTTCVSCSKKAEYIIITCCKAGHNIPRLFTKDMYMLTMDHIIPRYHGGTNSLSNKQPMCSFCNQNKADSLELSYSTNNVFNECFISSKEPSLACMVGSMYLWPEIPISYNSGQLYR